MQCAHNDGNERNNVPGNLKYKTPLENAADRYIHGTQTIGSRVGTAVLSESDIPTIRAMLTLRKSLGITTKDISDLYGVGKSAIESVLSGKCWTHVE